MQQLVSTWLALDGRRRMILLLGLAAVLVTFLSLSRLATAPSYSLLYSGLESSSAGDVIQALDAAGARYEVRGGAIYVESNLRDELRMTLASEGLPAMNGQGYELLDSLSGFGTTAQMFDAAYWRAKEGELARTIVSSPQIKAARVHISNSASGPFGQTTLGSASVTATSVGGQLSSTNAKAFRYLVASAVAGLSPEHVSVIDGRTGAVVNSENELSENGTGGDRATDLKHNVERLLEARVGVGSAVVEVNIETLTEREAITERRFDPEGRVAISTDTEERTNSSNDSSGGAVTVASNLPQGDGAGGDNSSSSQNSETRERVNFEVSETTREILRAPGSVRRITTAVLIDGVTTIDPATGAETWAPRSDDELAALQDLVASAVGFDADRGDVLTLKSMQFERPIIDGTGAPSSVFQNLNLDFMRLIQLGVLSLVSLVLGLFVLRPMFTGTGNVVFPELAAPNSSGAPIGLPDPNAETRQRGAADNGTNAAAPIAITGEIANDDFSAGHAPALSGGSPGEPQANDPVTQLRRMIEDRQDETVEILKNWIDDERETV